MLAESPKNSHIDLEDSFSARVWGLHQHVASQIRRLQPLFIVSGLWIALVSEYAAFEFFAGMRESIRWAPEVAVPFLVVMCGMLQLCAGVSIYRCLFVRDWRNWQRWQAHGMLRESSIAAQIADLTWYERLRLHHEAASPQRLQVKQLQQYLAWSANWMPYVFRLSTLESAPSSVEVRRVVASTAVNALPALPVPLGWLAITVGTICILALPTAWHRTPGGLIISILIFGFVPAIYLSVALVWMGWNRIGAFTRLLALCEMLVYGPMDGPALKSKPPRIVDFLEVRRHLRSIDKGSPDAGRPSP